MSMGKRATIRVSSKKHSIIEGVEEFIPTVEGTDFQFYDNQFIFDGERVEDIWIISANDTMDSAQIQHVTGDMVEGAYRHDGSLWTATVNMGPHYEWHDDVLEDLPEWVHVGGNWRYMDDE